MSLESRESHNVYDKTMPPKGKEVTDAETEKNFEKKAKELRMIKKNDPRRQGI